MFDAAIPPDAEAADPGGADDDWAKRHVATLRELAELGMTLARAVARQALAQVEGETEIDAPRTDPGLAFARVARTVRLTLALEARVHEAAIARSRPQEGWFDVEAAARRVREKFDAACAPKPLGPRGLEARGVVAEALDAERPDYDDAESRIDSAFDRLERRDPEDFRLDFPDRPIGEIVAVICRDLNLRPDWNRWAAEPWAVEEAGAQARGSPYATADPPPP